MVCYSEGLESSVGLLTPKMVDTLLNLEDAAVLVGVTRSNEEPLFDMIVCLAINL